MGWVYIIRGSSGRYYIGSTESPKRRLAEHKRGSNHTTKRLGFPLELITQVEFDSMEDARQVEKRLKHLKNPLLAIKVLGRLSRSSPE